MFEWAHIDQQVAYVFTVKNPAFAVELKLFQPSLQYPLTRLLSVAIFMGLWLAWMMWHMKCSSRSICLFHPKAIQSIRFVRCLIQAQEIDF